MNMKAPAFRSPIKLLPFLQLKYFLHFIFVLMVSLTIDSSAQLVQEEENYIWSAKKSDYQSAIKPEGKNYNLRFNSISDYLTIPLIYTYWFAISEPDGDKCPFHPSCSSFLMSSIDDTGLITGTLLFFDRFTRDANIVNRREHYPLIKNNKFFDAHYVYMLDGTGNANPWFDEYIHLMEKKK